MLCYDIREGLGVTMEVIITEWGLQSYIDLKSKGVFNAHEYKTILRPDAILLKTDDPFDKNHPKFGNPKFWGPATFNSVIIAFGYKMKWHNFGNGNVQLRLCVVITTIELEGKKEQRAFICNSYIKDDKTDKREMAKLKIKIKKIMDGTFIYRGTL
jgi:hypothetical protein